MCWHDPGVSVSLSLQVYVLIDDAPIPTSSGIIALFTGAGSTLSILN